MTVKASIPGLKPEDIDISITGDVLTIKGETHEEKEEKGGRGQAQVDRDQGQVAGRRDDGKGGVARLLRKLGFFWGVRRALT